MYALDENSQGDITSCLPCIAMCPPRKEKINGHHPSSRLTYTLLNWKSVLFFRDHHSYFTYKENYFSNHPLGDYLQFKDRFLKPWVLPTQASFPIKSWVYLECSCHLHARFQPQNKGDAGVSPLSLVSHITFCTYSTSTLNYQLRSRKPPSLAALIFRVISPLECLPRPPLSDCLTQWPVCLCL